MRQRRDSTPKLTTKKHLTTARPSKKIGPLNSTQVCYTGETKGMLEVEHMMKENGSAVDQQHVIDGLGRSSGLDGCGRLLDPRD